jgi:putative ATP-binding cassette transporter
VFGKPLIGLNFLQLKREADFRFGMVRIRENAESIAFYRGEAQEQQQVRRRFAAAFDTNNRLSSSQQQAERCGNEHHLPILDAWLGLG